MLNQVTKKPVSAVMAAPSGLLQRACGQHSIGGVCAECRQQREGSLQRAAVNADPVGDLPSIIHDVLQSPGQPLDGDTRAFMEQRFGHDFSQVRVHTDARAAESARAVNALAYTVKQDIAFDVGKYAPENRVGKQLLVHELAHVVQQSRGGAVAPSNLLNSPSEQAAEQAALDFNQVGSPIQISGATTTGLACQKATEATKPEPTIAFTKTKQAGRTVIAVNGVPIAESDVPPGEIEFFYSWTPENLDIVIVSPEGRKVFPIPGLNTNTALLKLSSHFTVSIKERLKVPRRTFNELEGGFNPLKEFETVETLTGQRPKPVPAKKAPIPPQAPPQPALPPTGSQPEAGAIPAATSSVQFLKPPPVNLDLSPASKYGKPKTEKEIVEERINKIIRDAIAGRSDISPLPKGLEPKSLVEAIKQGITEAVKPLIKDLPKTARDFILDKIDSAVEKGITGIADAALDATNLDDKTKAAIKKAVEAGIKLKPVQPGTEQK